MVLFQTPDSQLTPLPDAQTDRIKSDINLPHFLKPEQIGLNTKAIERLLQLAGFNRLIITTKATDTSQTEVMPLGHTKNGKGAGEAYAGKARMDTVPIQTHEVRKADDFDRNQTWPDLVVDINLEEIRQNSQEIIQNLRDIKLWAQEINDALIQAVLSAGIDNLMNLENYEVNLYGPKKLWATLNLILMFGSIAGIKIYPELNVLNFTYLTLSVITIMSHYYKSILDGGGREKKGRGYRTSLFYVGSQPDRTLILNVIGKTSTLIKTLDSK